MKRKESFADVAAYRPRPANAGMTLIEVLVVVSISAVLVAAVAASVAAGIMVWDRTKDFDEERMAALGFLQYLERDLRNTFSFYDLPFEGDAAGISFPGTGLDADPQDPTPSGVARVEYRFDETTHTIYRAVTRYPLAPGTSGEQVPLVTNVESAEFSYAGPATDTSGPVESRHDEWIAEDGEMPGSVHVKILLKQADRPVIVARTIRVPSRIAREEDEEDDDGQTDE